MNLLLILRKHKVWLLVRSKEFEIVEIYLIKLTVVVIENVSCAKPLGLYLDKCLCQNMSIFCPKK